MTKFTKSRVTILAVATVMGVSLLANQFVVTNSAPDITKTYVDKKTTNELNSANEPEIAAASPSNIEWTILPDIRNARFESTTVQYLDDLYAFNGFGPGIKIQPTVEKFDAGTQTWSVVSNTSIATGNAVTHNGVIVFGNEAWMIGGRVGNHPGAVTAKVWKFNLITYQWSEGPQLPVPVAAGGAAVVNNQIHWFGGIDPKAQCDVSNHYVYNLENPSTGWTDISGIAPMPIPRNHFATVVHNGLIYAIGGQFTHDGCGAGTPDTDLVHEFNPQTNTWTQKASLPAIQSHIEPSSFVYQGAIYVVGGATNGNKVYRYDPSNDLWDTVAELPQALLAPVARVIDNQLVVSSGGAPATIPSLATYTTDMTPLLLPNADESLITETPDQNSIPSEAGLVWLEAEQYDTLSASDTHQWISMIHTGASNNEAMVTPNTKQLRHGSQESPSMGYFTYFDRPGTWYLWLRGLGDTSNGEGKNDSIHAGLNGSLSTAADKIDNFPPSWSWTNSTRDQARASLEIPSTGIHAVNLWMREDGLAVDKILLTTDANYQPTGIGPTNTDDTAVDDNSPDNTTDDDGTPLDDINLLPIDPTPEPAPPATEVTPDSTTEDDSQESAENNIDPDSNITESGSGGSDTTNQNPVSTDGIVAIEIENFSSTESTSDKQWIRSTQAGASGNAAMVTTPDTGTIRFNNQNSPSLSYQVYFDEAGSYTVWLRGWGDTVNNEGKNDSAHVGINNTLSSAAAIQNFPARWSWSSSKRTGGAATLAIPSEGLHTINIWMREDGLILDKLILSKDPGYIPSGEGAQVTLGSITTDTETTPDTPIEDDPATPTNAANDTVVGEDLLSIEVESYTSTTAQGAHQWLENHRAGANGSAMEATPNTGKLNQSAANSATMNYQLTFTEAGTYTVWIRGWGDSNSAGKNDSVHVGINNNFNTTQVLENFPDAWSWSNKKRGGGVVTVTVPTTGTHTLNLSMREDGVVLDTIVLTKDGSLTPNDFALPNTPDTENTSINVDQPWRNQTTINNSTVQKRHEAGGVVFNGKLYVLGGRGTRNVSVYDPVSNKWTQLAAPPIELNHFQPVVANDKIWIIGAFTGPYPGETSVADIYTYTPASNKWAKEGTIPQARRRGSAGAAVHDGFIYLVGGNTNGHRPGAVAWLDRFNPTTGQWQVLADASIARDHITVSVSNNKLVAAAGRQSAHPDVFGNTIAITDVYDLTTQRWSSKQPIPTQRAGAMTVTVGNEVIVIGGEIKSARDAKNTVESYNVVNDTWRQLSPLQVGRHSGAAAILNNEIHVISGSEKRGGSPESTAHEVLDF